MPYSEQTALTNLAVTPGKIIATDVAAIQNLASDFGASTLSVNKVVATAPGGQHAQAQGSNRPGQHGCGPEGQGRDSRFGDACPPRREGQRQQPVSTAIKAIKEASKGSYVGRHCADAAGAKASAHNGEDGSKGSNGK